MHALIHPRFLSQTAGRLGRGGETWMRTRMSGEGVAAPRTEETAEIGGYAWKASDLRTALALPPVDASETEWYFATLPAVDVQGEDQIASISEPGFVLFIHGPADDPLPGLTLWRAEQQAG